VDDPEHFPDWVYRLGPAEMMTAIYHRLDTAMSHFKVKLNLQLKIFYHYLITVLYKEFF
jgi:hypothetical protein